MNRCALATVAAGILALVTVSLSSLASPRARFNAGSASACPDGDKKPKVACPDGDKKPKLSDAA